MIPTNTIDRIIAGVIEREGGFVDHVNDKGGATKYGVTQATLAAYRKRPVSLTDVRNLTATEAKEIYARNYVEPFAAVVEVVPLIFLEFLVNSAVQHGVARAARWLQKAANVAEDGQIGPVTREAVAEDPGAVLLRLIAIRARFYGDIIARDATQRVFAAGWFRRLADDLA